MNVCCCRRKKITFYFENGTRVIARTYIDALQKLKKASQVTRAEHLSGSRDFHYGKDVTVFVEQNCSTPLANDRAGWNLYLDKRDPVLVGSRSADD